MCHLFSYFTGSGVAAAVVYIVQNIAGPIQYIVHIITWNSSLFI
jgi:hypothetical protein